MTREGLTTDEVREVLKEHPLIGPTQAARVLGIKAPNVSRLKKNGRMPAVVPVEGLVGDGVYFLSEVEALAGELRAERAAAAAGGRGATR